MAIAGVTKFWLGFDKHRPYSDDAVDRIALAFIKDFKPTIRVAGGDWQNCDQSVFTKKPYYGPSFDDECEMVEHDLDAFGITHYLQGNHEERAERDHIDPTMRPTYDLRKKLHLRERGIKYYPYHRTKGVLRLGKLSVLHGFYTNEYVAAATSKAYGCCVFGHAHRFQTFTPKQAFLNNTGFAIGMMGQLIQPYEKASAPRGHAQGFAFGYLHKNGHFDLYTVRIKGPSVVIEGKNYSKKAAK